MNIASTRQPIANGYAEPREQAPKVAVIDDFDGDESGYPHGQAVESVLLSHSDLSPAQVQRIQNTPDQVDVDDLMRAKGIDFRSAYGAALVRNVAKFYLSTAQNLHLIVKEQPSVKVIEQSQGETPARLMGTLLQGLRSNEAIRQHAMQSFGLPAEAPLPELCEKMLNVADSIIGNNELVGKARQEYLKASKAAHDKGIVYLVAGGNHGDLAYEMEKMGVKASPNAYRSIFVSDYATVVGAHTADRTPSNLNSPGSGAEAYALGERLAWESKDPGLERQGVDDGTSLAVPIVTGQVLRMLDADATLSPFDIESKLQGLASTKVENGQIKATSNDQSLIADGQIEPYIIDHVGEGFVTDIYGETARQMAAAKQDRTFFGLPGTEDHEFQLLRISPDPHGVRQLRVDTYFIEGHHVLRANIKDGAWDPASVVEELHLDGVRQREIEAKVKTTPAEASAT